MESRLIKFPLKVELARSCRRNTGEADIADGQQALLTRERRNGMAGAKPSDETAQHLGDTVVTADGAQGARAGAGIIRTPLFLFASRAVPTEIVLGTESVDALDAIEMTTSLTATPIAEVRWFLATCLAGRPWRRRHHGAHYQRPMRSIGCHCEIS